MPETKARTVAEYFIDFSRQVGDPLTNLKLQKLLYYAQGWYLALKDKPLFSERIEAWPHGPAIPPVYGEYKEWKWKPIGGKVSASPDEFSAPVLEHLHEIMQVFGSLTAYQLERMTHREKPWLDARGDLPIDAPSHNVITHDSMKKYFAALAAQQES